MIKGLKDFLILKASYNPLIKQIMVQKIQFRNRNSDFRNLFFSLKLQPYLLSCFIKQSYHLPRHIMADDGAFRFTFVY